MHCNGDVVTEASAETNAKLEDLLDEGAIGLQNWATPVEFRNIYIKELPNG